MEKQIKIIFEKPRHLPSSIDGIEIYYPYQIKTITKERYKIDKEENIKRGVKVSISGSLAINWGFQIWQPSEKYTDLIKLLLPYAINEIKRKFEEGTLNDFEEIVLLTSNHPEGRVYDINELPEVEGHEDVLVITDDKKNISEEIGDNKLAGEIIQYRDLINAVIYNYYNERLLELDQERNLLEFFKSATSIEEFSHRIASIGSLVGKMNKQLLIKMTNPTDISIGTIALLKNHIESLDKTKIESVEVLRKINKLRQGYPIHTDKAEGVIDAYAYFNIEYPIIDFQKAWKTLLEKYLESLKLIFDLLKTELMKK